MNIANEVKATSPIKIHSFIVTARDIKRFAQSIGNTNPLHYDESFARQTSFGTIIAPPLFCQCMAFEDVPLTKLPDDLSPVELDVDLPVTKTLGGESRYTFYKYIRPGDIITVTTQMKDVIRKKGRSGELFLISIETRFINQLGETVAEELATYVKR